MRSSVPKCAKQAPRATQTFDHATPFDLHHSVGLSIIVF